MRCQITPYEYTKNTSHADNRRFGSTDWIELPNFNYQVAQSNKNGKVQKVIYFRIGPPENNMRENRLSRNTGQNCRKHQQILNLSKRNLDADEIKLLERSLKLTPTQKNYVQELHKFSRKLSLNFSQTRKH